MTELLKGCFKKPIKIWGRGYRPNSAMNLTYFNDLMGVKSFRVGDNHGNYGYG